MSAQCARSAYPQAPRQQRHLLRRPPPRGAKRACHILALPQGEPRRAALRQGQPWPSPHPCRLPQPQLSSAREQQAPLPVHAEARTAPPILQSPLLLDARFEAWLTASCTSVPASRACQAGPFGLRRPRGCRAGTGCARLSAGPLCVGDTQARIVLHVRHTPWPWRPVFQGLPGRHCLSFDCASACKAAQSRSAVQLPAPR